MISKAGVEELLAAIVVIMGSFFLFIFGFLFYFPLIFAMIHGSLRTGRCEQNLTRIEKDFREMVMNSWS